MISLMEASVSTEMDVSPLPLREEVPPREARVAADSPGRLREPWKATRTECDFRQKQSPLQVYCNIVKWENPQRLMESSKGSLVGALWMPGN